MPWLLLLVARFLIVRRAGARTLKARVQKLIDSSGAEVAVALRTLDGSTSC